jgi:hypothetical protein
MMKRSVAATILMALVALNVFAQQKTLREEVRERGYANHVSSGDLPHFGPHNLDKLIEGSDLIVRGEVLNSVARLTADETMVMTDYTIKINEVLKDPAHLAQVGGELVISKFGGKLLLEGKPVEWKTPNFPEFTPRTTAVFFVAHASTPNNYWDNAFYAGNMGVWRFKDGKMDCETEQKQKAGYTAGWCNKSESDVLSDVKTTIAVANRELTGLQHKN